MDLDKILHDPLSRRQFLTRMSAAGLGAAAVALLAGCGGGSSNGGNNGNNGNNGNGGGSGSGSGNPAFSPIPGVGDIQILNYALALETTEADIYRQALNLASNRAVTTPLSSSGPSAYGTTYTGGNAGTLTGNNANVAFLYLAQFAYVEAAHRDFLLTTLGHSADTPGQPTTSNKSNPVVNAAGYKFQPATTSLSDIMALILAAEETGVTAYLGAVPYISATAQGLAYAQVAASIYSTEARHSSAVRYIFNADIGPGGPDAPNLPAAYSGTSGPYVAGSAQPNAGASNEFEYALGPQAVLHDVITTFYA
jgi:hypothetical protein